MYHIYNKGGLPQYITIYKCNVWQYMNTIYYYISEGWRQPQLMEWSGWKRWQSSIRNRDALASSQFQIWRLTGTTSALSLWKYWREMISWNTFWYFWRKKYVLMKCLGISVNILVFLKICWHFWKYFGISENILAFLKIFWYFWKHLGISENILVFLKIFWSFWKHFGISENVLVFLKTFWHFWKYS